MKKVLFLQNQGKTYGGVWNVNKMIGENLINKGYSVHIVSIRNFKSDVKLEYNDKLVVKTINEIDEWGTFTLNDIFNSLKKLHIIKAIKMFILKLYYLVGFNKDIRKLHKYIYKYNPDYIVTSHYQIIDMIPKCYLSRTIHQQHSSFENAINHKATMKTFDKYRNKIKFLWLSKMTMENAINRGYNNSEYIYNAVRFRCLERANVIKNKKLVAISRISSDKNIDRMIGILEDIFSDNKYVDWVFELYGDGDEEAKIKAMIKNKRQIKLMGVTKDPKSVLMGASINLNTSRYEGFSLTILESCECGVPTIAFNFGESAGEQILDNKTGIIAKDINDYKKRLKELMDNYDKLEELSINVKEFANNFQIEIIIDKWINLFNSMDSE